MPGAPTWVEKGPRGRALTGCQEGGEVLLSPWGCGGVGSLAATRPATYSELSEAGNLSDGFICLIHSTAFTGPNTVPGTVMGTEIQKSWRCPVPSWGKQGVSGTSQWGGGARGLQSEAGRVEGKGQGGLWQQGPRAGREKSRIGQEPTGPGRGSLCSALLCLETPQEDRACLPVSTRPNLKPALPLGSGEPWACSGRTRAEKAWDPSLAGRGRGTESHRPTGGPTCCQHFGQMKPALTSTWLLIASHKGRRPSRRGAAPAARPPCWSPVPSF